MNGRFRAGRLLALGADRARDGNLAGRSGDQGLSGRACVNAGSAGVLVRSTEVAALVAGAATLEDVLREQGAEGFSGPLGRYQRGMDHWLGELAGAPIRPWATTRPGVRVHGRHRAGRRWFRAARGLTATPERLIETYPASVRARAMVGCCAVMDLAHRPQDVFAKPGRSGGDVQAGPRLDAVRAPEICGVCVAAREARGP